MAPSSSFSQDDGFAAQQPDAVPQEPALPEKSAEDQSLLDEVLKQTQAAFDSQQLRDHAGLEPFLQVARRYQGQPFGLQPVLSELVHSALREHFQDATQPHADWERIAARVATSLFEDPVSHDRLEAFWARLSAMQR